MDHDDSTTIKSLKLPAGWRLQWRSDAHWRQVHAQHHRNEMAGLLAPGEAFEWTPWGGDEAMEGKGGGRWDGTPTWWSLVGELLDGAGVDVVLADGHRPPILQVGRVWACTWVSPPPAGNRPPWVERGHHALLQAVLPSRLTKTYPARPRSRRHGHPAVRAERTVIPRCARSARSSRGASGAHGHPAVRAERTVIPQAG